MRWCGEGTIELSPCSNTMQKQENQVSIMDPCTGLVCVRMPDSGPHSRHAPKTQRLCNEWLLQQECLWRIFKTALLSYNLHTKQFNHWTYWQIIIHLVVGVSTLTMVTLLRWGFSWVMEGLLNSHEVIGVSSLPISYHSVFLLSPMLSLMDFLPTDFPDQDSS